MVAHTYEPNMNNLFGSTLITSYTDYNTTFVTKIYNKSMYMSMSIMKMYGKDNRSGSAEPWRYLWNEETSTFTPYIKSLFFFLFVTKEFCLKINKIARSVWDKSLFSCHLQQN